jgi:hypothetical protein
MILDHPLPAAQIRDYRDFLEQQRLMFLNVTDTVVLNQQQREIDQERKEEAIRQKASGRIEKLRDLGAFVPREMLMMMISVKQCITNGFHHHLVSSI